MAKFSIVLGITGGIAAYKSVDLVSKLKKASYDVNVILTENGSNFVTPLSLETLSGNPIVTDMFVRETTWEVEHIALAKKADLFLIAPATANLIGKLANGIADDMLTTTIMACKCPILLAPAMNTNMYNNKVVQDNLAKLKKMGVTLIGPDSGQLACGDIGAGRMSEPDEIVDACNYLINSTKDLYDKKIVITAGPTREYIDPIRFISNGSSGKMGYAIAKAAAKRGANVTLISGPVSTDRPDYIDIRDIMTTNDMFKAVIENFDDCDAIVMCAAPCDFTPKKKSETKMKKSQSINWEFEQTTDIALAINGIKAKQKVILFAAETNDLVKNATEKCIKKGADMLVANDITKAGAGFGTDTNIVSFIYPDGKVVDHKKMSKDLIATKILDELINIFD